MMKIPIASVITFILALSLYSIGIGIVSQQNVVFNTQSLAENQPNLQHSLSVEAAIELAKQAVIRLDSPPRMYASGGSSVDAWPNQPALVEVQYGTCGIRPPEEMDITCTASMMLASRVEPNVARRGYNVTFQSTWSEFGKLLKHCWRFYVSEDRQVTFLGEVGDELPPLRM